MPKALPSEISTGRKAGDKAPNKNESAPKASGRSNRDLAETERRSAGARAAFATESVDPAYTGLTAGAMALAPAFAGLPAVSDHSFNRLRG